MIYRPFRKCKQNREMLSATVGIQLRRAGKTLTAAMPGSYPENAGRQPNHAVTQKVHIQQHRSPDVSPRLRFTL